MAAEAIVSTVLERLISITARKVQQEVRLVADVTKEIKRLTSNFKAIQAVLADAEQRQLKDKVVAGWLDKLKDVAYDMEDVLDEWNTAILKVQINERFENEFVPKKKVRFCFPLPRLCFKRVALRHDIGVKIKEINESLDSIAKEKDAYNLNMNIRSVEVPERLKTSSFVDVSGILGRDVEKNDLVNMLLSESLVEEKSLDVISIVGMGGIGKTTLAQFAYNDEKVKSNFHKRIWVSVSDHFDEIRIAKAIVEGLTYSVSNFVELQSLLNNIHDSVAETKFLLVLDDVWTEEYSKWEPLYNSLNNGLHGSKILVTTRKTTVARMMRSIEITNIEELSEDGSWLLFRQLAFSDRSPQECEILDEIGREIVGKCKGLPLAIKTVGKCKGLPLAIKTVGSLLRFKKTKVQWKRILDSEMWSLEELEDVFRPLLLSYNDLPPRVKPCFLYCAIFPKDYNYIRKDELIKLWMAQGYLGLEQEKELEIIGEDYFDILAQRSFFQEFIKDEDENIIRCGMHDIVHDFAQFLVKNECFTMVISDEEPSSLSCTYENARHSTLIVVDEEVSFPTNISSFIKLRSLLVRKESVDSSLESNCLPNLFKQLRCLRALDLCGFFHEDQITKIPNEIGKLIHLRYLNVSSLTGIEELPETLCELYNLQTLNLSECRKLGKLPQGMRKLINLRHLINNETDALSWMPKGIEKLVCLRTLSKLVVGGDPHNSQVCTLDCLKMLDCLRGSLVLRGLGNVRDGAEAKNAKLSSKEYLLDLRLCFDDKSEASSTEASRKDEAVLEALHPPQNLEKLWLKWYRGISFGWITSLTQLRKLTLKKCMNCEYLPPLGNLPSLETLKIKDMVNLKKVGDEFLGIRNGARLSSSSVIVFPKLNHLLFENIQNWEDWEYDKTREITIMPCLSSLCIFYCPKLKSLPSYLSQVTSLKTFDVHCCDALMERPEI